MAREEIVTRSNEFAESIINAVREPLISLDQDLRVVAVSRSFYEFFKVKPEETVGRLIYDLGNKQWDIPKLRELLEAILPEKSSFDNYEVEHDFATIGRRTMLLNARQIERGRGEEPIILLAIEDITERKRLLNLLIESEERYRRIFETANDGIVLLEKGEGRIVHANPAAEKMLGYLEEEFVGKKLHDIGVSLDLSDFPMFMQTLNKSGILNYRDVPVKTKSGQTIDTDIYMVDKAKLAQCNIRDVSERHRAEEALKAEKAFIENALNTLRDVFFAIDLEGRFLRWNKALNVITGYLDTEIALMAPLDFFRNDDRERIAAAIQTVLQKGSVSVEALLVTEDGRRIPYEFRAALLSDAQGKLLGICGVGRDISERKQAERELRAALVNAREGENRLEAIMAAMGEGISLQDIDFNVIYQNQVHKDLIGDHVGERCYLAYQNSDHICEGCPVVMAYKDGGTHKAERIRKAERAVTGDATTRYVEITASPLRDVAGNIVAGIELIMDVTEQKKLEAQLRQSQKMEAIGTLAGGIAHDFNNILNVVMGYGAMVMGTLAADSQSKKDMHEVLLAADRAADLTKRLLVFSRKQVVEVKSVNLNELILGLQKMLVRIIRENIDFHLDLAGRPLIVQVDAGQIEQVLTNLAANARDAMPEGGRLTIGTGLEEVNEEHVAIYGYGKPGRYALVTVADTGQGMDAETQKKIFEPFFTTKGVGEGTGLGLAISYGIIKQHNGYIQVYSEPGHGTVFKIYLPLSEEAAAPDTETEVAVPVKGGNETILVAEDNPALRKLATIILESRGYTVIAAEDGEEAVTKFMENREHISLVVLDMIMPKKNGKEVSVEIRKVCPKIKILFASGYTMDLVTTKELTEAGFDFIQKPFPSKDLLAKVREILDR